MLVPAHTDAEGVGKCAGIAAGAPSRADPARTEPERSCLSAAEDDGACGEIVQPTIVTIEDDSGNDENDQQCPDEGLEHSGDVSVEASHLDSEDPMAHRVAEGADEQEVLESEEARSDERVRRIEQIRDRQTHQP